MSAPPDERGRFGDYGGRFAPETLMPAGLSPTRYVDGRMRLYENRDRPGRAWAVYGARVVSSPTEALERVLDPAFDPRREVVLERRPSGTYPEVATRAHSLARVRYPSPTRAEA